jgi:hypothetical protein
MDGHVQIVVHAGGPGTVEDFQGRPHRVVPATLVKSKILSNNLGKTYLPPDAFTPAWAEVANGSPVVVDHPQSRGVAASAREPSVMNQLGAGTLYRVRAADGAMRGHVYLDLSRVDAVPDLKVILARLDAGEKVELSTGFPVSIDNTPGVVNGAEYDRVIMPIGFDHLAVFANQTGACSIKDGCGLAANDDADDPHWTFALNKTEDAPMAEDTEPQGKVAQVIATLSAELRKLFPLDATGETPAEVPGAEPVPEPAANSAGDHTGQGETAMNREQMIAQLTAAGRKVEALNALSDCDLTALVRASVTPAANTEPEQKGDGWDLYRAERAKREELEARTANAVESENKERERLLGDVLYAKESPWTDDEVKGMGINELRKVHAALCRKSADYTGRGGPRAGNSAPVLRFASIMDGPAGASVLDRKEAN